MEKRIIVQITAGGHNLYALDNYGQVWHSGNIYEGWNKVEELPQDDLLNNK